MSKTLIAVCAFFLLAVAPAVKADPIVVTSGSLTVPGFLRAPQYSFSGQNFSVNGAGSEFGSAPGCFPCASGGSINLSSLFVGGSLGTGSLTVNGTTFNNLFFGGLFQFTAGTVLIPAATTNISLTSPFTFSGNLAACPLELGGPDCTPSKQIFSAALVGQGLATLQLRFLGLTAGGASLYQFENITYTFDSAEIPEPATITLLAAGLAGLAARRFRKKRSVAE
jgi:hypothetical protein